MPDGLAEPRAVSPAEPLAGLPRGARLGIDVGKARIGVAASDPDGLLAMPVETVARSANGSAAPGSAAAGSASGGSASAGPASAGSPLAGADAKRIAEIARERGAVVAYFGLPKHLSGREGPATADARRFAREVGQQAPDLELRLIDERLTTVTASGNLREAGRRAARQKSVIDQQAAVIILQSALDAERATARRAGAAAAGARRNVPGGD